MTDQARVAAFGAMNNVRTAIDSAKRIGFTGNVVRVFAWCLCYTFVHVACASRL